MDGLVGVEAAEPRMSRRAIRIGLATAGLVLGGMLFGVSNSASAAEPSPDSLLGTVTSVVTETVQAVPVVNAIVAPAPPVTPAPVPAPPVASAPAPAPAAAPAPAPTPPPAATSAPAVSVLALVVSAVPAEVAAPVASVTSPVDTVVSSGVTAILTPVVDLTDTVVGPVVDLADGVIAGLPIVGRITGPSPVGGILDGVTGALPTGGLVTGVIGTPAEFLGSGSNSGREAVSPLAFVSVAQTSRAISIDGVSSADRRGARPGFATVQSGPASAPTASPAASATTSGAPLAPMPPVAPSPATPASGSASSGTASSHLDADLSEHPVFLFPSSRLTGVDAGAHVAPLSNDPGSSPD